MSGSSSPAAPGADTSGDSYLPEHGNGGYRVRHYDLDLDYRVAPNRLSARVQIHAIACRTLSRFSFDLTALRVTRVRVDGRTAKFTQRSGKLHVTPAAAVPSGREFTTEVRYTGNPRPVGGRWGEIGWDELTDGALVASQPVGAPSWFPCNDHPADKASYRISLTTASPYTVLVTGELVSRRHSGSTTTWVYERAEPTASYLMSVQIGRYEELVLASEPVPQRAAVPARLWAACEKDFARHEQIMRSLVDWFGPYPFREYVVVVTDDDLDEPIEAQGMSIFGANHVDGRRTNERLVVHELAHQWFGNSLTVEDWRHIWLNEGFATYSEWLWSQAAGGPSTKDLAEQWHRALAASTTGLLVGDPGVAGMFDETVYKRGALTLYALHRRLGDERFFALLRAWTTANRYGQVSTSGFTTLATEHAGEPLDELFDSWLWRAELPPLPA